MQAFITSVICWIVQTMPNRQVATTGGGGEHKVRNMGRVTEFSHYWGVIEDAHFSAQMQTFGLKSKAHYSGGHTLSPCWYTCSYTVRESITTYHRDVL